MGCQWQRPRQQRERRKLAVAVKSDLDGNQLARRWLAGLVCLESTGRWFGCIALETWGLGRGRPAPDRTGGHRMQCRVRRGASFATE